MPFQNLKNGSKRGAEITCFTIPISTDFCVCIQLLPFGLYLRSKPRGRYSLFLLSLYSTVSIFMLYYFWCMSGFLRHYNINI